MGLQMDPLTERLECPISRDVFHRKADFVLHLSGNGGHDFEENPDAVDMTFQVVHAPVIESIEISQGFASQANFNTLLVGRGETRTLSLKGTYFQTAEGREPMCFFTAFRQSTALSVD
jgi:hypothetical protein